MFSLKNISWISVLATIGIVSALAAYVPFDITSGTNKMRIETVSFGGTSSTLATPTRCAASPCVIDGISTSGWVTSITRSSAGQYVMAIASGVFSATPICGCTVRNTAAGTNNWCGVENMTSSTSVTILDSFPTNAADDSNTVWCMGPR